jgi:hypothetical protein
VLAVAQVGYGGQREAAVGIGTRPGDVDPIQRDAQRPGIDSRAGIGQVERDIRPPLLPTPSVRGSGVRELRRCGVDDVERPEAVAGVGISL